MSTQQKLSGSPEVLGAFLSSELGANADQLKDNANDFIAEKYGVNFPVSINIVENSGDTLHLALPFYAAMDKMNAASIGDDEAGDIAGGEIFALASLAIGVGVGAGIMGNLGLLPHQQK